MEDQVVMDERKWHSSSEIIDNLYIEQALRDDLFFGSEDRIHENVFLILQTWKKYSKSIQPEKNQYEIQTQQLGKEKCHSSFEDIELHNEVSLDEAELKLQAKSNVDNELDCLVEEFCKVEPCAVHFKLDRPIHKELPCQNHEQWLLDNTSELIQTELDLPCVDSNNTFQIQTNDLSEKIESNKEDDKTTPAVTEEFYLNDRNSNVQHIKKPFEIENNWVETNVFKISKTEEADVRANAIETLSLSSNEIPQEKQKSSNDMTSSSRKSTGEDLQGQYTFNESKTEQSGVEGEKIENIETKIDESSKERVSNAVSLPSVGKLVKEFSYYLAINKAKKRLLSDGFFHNINPSTVRWYSSGSHVDTENSGKTENKQMQINEIKNENAEENITRDPPFIDAMDPLNLPSILNSVQGQCNSSANNRTEEPLLIYELCEDIEHSNTLTQSNLSISCGLKSREANEICNNTKEKELPTENAVPHNEIFAIETVTLSDPSSLNSNKTPRVICDSEAVGVKSSTKISSRDCLLNCNFYDDISPSTLLPHSSLSNSFRLTSEQVTKSCDNIENIKTKISEVVGEGAVNKKTCGHSAIVSPREKVLCDSVVDDLHLSTKICTEDCVQCKFSDDIKLSTPSVQSSSSRSFGLNMDDGKIEEKKPQISEPPRQNACLQNSSNILKTDAADTLISPSIINSSKSIKDVSPNKLISSSRTGECLSSTRPFLNDNDSSTALMQSSSFSIWPFNRTFPNTVNYDKIKNNETKINGISMKNAAVKSSDDILTTGSIDNLVSLSIADSNDSKNALPDSSSNEMASSPKNYNKEERLCVLRNRLNDIINCSTSLSMPSRPIGDTVELSKNKDLAGTKTDSNLKVALIAKSTRSNTYTEKCKLDPNRFKTIKTIQERQDNGTFENPSTNNLNVHCRGDKVVKSIPKPNLKEAKKSVFNDNKSKIDDSLKTDASKSSINHLSYKKSNSKPLNNLKPLENNYVFCMQRGPLSGFQNFNTGKKAQLIDFEQTPLSSLIPPTQTNLYPNATEPDVSPKRKFFGTNSQFNHTQSNAGATILPRGMQHAMGGDNPIQSSFSAASAPRKSLLQPPFFKKGILSNGDVNKQTKINATITHQYHTSKLEQESADKFLKASKDISCIQPSSGSSLKPSGIMRPSSGFYSLKVTENCMHQEQTIQQFDKCKQSPKNILNSPTISPRSSELKRNMATRSYSRIPRPFTDSRTTRPL